MFVPSINTPELRLMYKQLNIKDLPFNIKVIPSEGATINDCFINVPKQIELYGGKIVYGWQFWQTDELMLQAEAHAVWQNQHGEFLDITPKQISTNEILFAKANIKYCGKQIDNVRLNISNNKLIDDFILLSELNFRILNKGNRASEYAIVSSLREIELLNLIETYKYELLHMAKRAETRNALCFCKSLLKYKHCHAKKIKKLIERY